MELLLATRNAHKVREFRELLGDAFALRDLGAFPDIKLPKETGCTFEENARLKALAVSQSRDDLVVADDSGLEVDALDGAPGIFSARYASEHAGDNKNIAKLLAELEKIGARELSKRSARFRCVLALAQKGKILETCSGVVEGAIVDLPRGSGGFGYDPVFLPNGFDQTFGELPAHVKNAVSHRARAVQALRTALQSSNADQGFGGGGGGAPGAGPAWPPEGDAVRI
jgi:XTP/dITP diphosphohydrolase